MATQDNKQEEIKTAAPSAETAESAPASAPESKDQEEGTRFDHIREALELLCERFPKAFIKEGNCKPLKIGIFADLRAACEGVEGLSVSKVRAALRYYTTRLRYLYCLKEGARRVDLDGSEGEAVSAEHASFAADKFKEINARRKPRKSAKNPKNQNGQRRPRRIEGRKPEIAELKKGVEVRVLTGDRHYVRATVSEDASKDTVLVLLQTGMSLTVPVDRVLLPESAPKKA
ncbi:MAG: RNA chaperone ProQ [Succinivibrio sp.]|nr:RNA chaperone ProQ [Succinivibrio sp.]